jgi:hypothetical protein
LALSVGALGKEIVMDCSSGNATLDDAIKKLVRLTMPLPLFTPTIYGGITASQGGAEQTDALPGSTE